MYILIDYKAFLYETKIAINSRKIYFRIPSLDQLSRPSQGI